MYQTFPCLGIFFLYIMQTMSFFFIGYCICLSFDDHVKLTEQSMRGIRCFAREMIAHAHDCDLARTVRMWRAPPELGVHNFSLACF